MLCRPVTFHYHMYVVTCFHMVLHMTIADSCRYPVLWMSLDRLVGSATSICVVLISLLFASVSYALLRFDRMHRATLELSLASEAICSQAPHQTQIWQTCEDGNGWKWGVPENHGKPSRNRLFLLTHCQITRGYCSASDKPFSSNA